MQVLGIKNGMKLYKYTENCCFYGSPNESDKAGVDFYEFKDGKFMLQLSSKHCAQVLCFFVLKLS